MRGTGDRAVSTIAIAMRRTGLAGLLVFLLTATPAHALDFNEPAWPLSPIRIYGIPSAIEHGDFDRDGIEDLAVGDNGNHEIKFLRGTGGGKFAFPSASFAATLPVSIEAGHFDGDGDLDLAVVNLAGDRLTILRGAAGVTFTNAGEFTTADGPVQVDAADLNGDSDLDLVVTEQGAQGSATVVETVAVYIGGAGITFSGPRRYTAGQAAVDTVVVDLTGDRRPEIVVANREERNLAVFRNIGDGTFTSRTIVSLPVNPDCVDAGHLNGDGRPDLAVCLGDAHAVRLLAGTGGTGFTELGNLSAGSTPIRAKLRDFDADGDDDLVVANLFSDDISVFERTAQAMTTVRRIPLGRPDSMIGHDLDGDRAADVAVTNGAGWVRLMLSTAAPPETTITTRPPAASSTNSPTFAFTSSEPYSTFQCRVVGRGEFAYCRSPKTLAALPDGDYEFQVRAVDASSAADPTAATATFRIDATPPDATIGGGPTGATNDATPSFTVGASEPATLACRLNGAPVNPCSSAVTLGPLADGDYTFEVGATDSVGNSDPDPARRTFTVDTVPPAAPTLSERPGPISQPSGRFAFSSPGADRFECRLGGAVFGACLSPYEFSGLAEGEWTFAVRAVDAAGNVGAPSAHTWTVDGTPPDTAIESGPAVLAGVNTGQITFSTTGGEGFECRLGPADFAPCASPYEFTGLADGPQAFEVRARDAAGNLDGSPALHTWTIDTRPPETVFTGGPEGSTSDDTPTFDFSAPGEDAATFECSLDAAPFTPCASPLTLGPLVPGRHVLRVRAVDAAGHADPTPAERSLVVEAPALIADLPAAIRDLTPPAIGRLTLRPKSRRHRSPVQLRFTLSEPARVLIVLERRLGRRYVRVAQREISASAGKVAVDLFRRSGSHRLRAVPHRLRVTATDAAGNRSPARTLGCACVRAGGRAADVAARASGWS